MTARRMKITEIDNAGSPEAVEQKLSRVAAYCRVSTMEMLHIKQPLQ